MAGEEVQFGLLGPLDLRLNHNSVPLGTPKQRAVLAVLIINRNRPVAIDKLIDAVWGSEPPVAARPNVHSYVSNVRRLVSAAGIDPHGVVAKAPNGYRVIAADSQCDLARFLAARDAGLNAAAAGQFEKASTSLAAALAEWRGPALEDLQDFAFAEEFARVQAENKLSATIAHAEAEIACGRAGSIIGGLEALTTEYPYREPIWGHLITAYYLNGLQADALDAYHRLKRVLADDLGIDPGAQVRALFNRVLRQLPLNVHKAAKSNAEKTILAIDAGNSSTDAPAAALVDSTGRRHPLAGRATRIGRSRDNDIVVADPLVSRHHAVVVDNTTHFDLIDLGSANGVYILGERISGSAVLNDGDRVSFGEQQYSFQKHAAPDTG